MGLVKGHKSGWGYRTYPQSNSWGSWAYSGWRDVFGVSTTALPVPMKTLVRKQSQVIYQEVGMGEWRTVVINWNESGLNYKKNFYSTKQRYWKRLPSETVPFAECFQDSPEHPALLLQLSLFEQEVGVQTSWDPFQPEWFRNSMISQWVAK